MSFSLQLRFVNVTAALIAIVPLCAVVRADDWPQWRGVDRDGVLRETGILTEIPAQGLKIAWRARIGLGYSGPVVAQNRVFVTDRRLGPAVERVLCFDAATGKPLWVHSYPCDYANMDYGSGPRASPTVHEGKVYTLGSRGHLFCLDAASGAVVWKKDLVNEYDARIPRYGCSAAPLVEGDFVIVCVGGQPEASVVAFDRNTGQERWKALPDRPAYSAPIVVTAGGCRQLIVWTAETVSSLEPASGKVYWQVPYKTTFDDAQVVASPVLYQDLLLCLTAWNRGSFMLKLDADKPAARVLWKTRSQPTTTISTPLFLDERHFYAIVSDGSLACLDATSGEELWSTHEPTGSTPLSNAHLTRHGDQVFLFNQKGHLILAQLTPAGYQQRGRCFLIEPTAGVRAQGPVTWSHPAYADRHVFARNDRELVSASLVASGAAQPDVSSPKLVTNSRTIGKSTHSQAVLALALSPDGKSLAAGLWGGNILRLDVETGQELPAPAKHRNWVCSLAFSPDGRLLASAGGNEFLKAAELRLWDIRDKTEYGRLDGHADKVLSVAFSPDGKTLASSSADCTVRLWDPVTLKERAVLMGHTDAVWSVAFSSDGKMVASAGFDRTVRLWDATSGVERACLSGHEEEILAVRFSPGGRTLATGSADGSVGLWDIATSKQRAVLKGHHGAVHCLAFSSNGTILASGSGDETVKLWDIATGTELASLQGHHSTVSSVAFSPDAGTLFSAGMEDAIRIWVLPAVE
jgi:outer membrane protein assembly factor BamB